ncbi:MAG: molybdopterin-dependent oxidoreductase, partial [SAR324 cluster bacterium]|nr:molybdopterin-dependent oxidoreductase [SAR324 cluster bacterium]
MKKKSLITRRRFVIASAVAGGALALGFVFVPIAGRYRRAKAIREIATASGEFRPNAWLVITPDGRIVFKLDRVEMGQGTMTSHTMLIAEELRVDPRKIQVEFAVADRSYDNPEFGVQITGGSTSVKTSWENLRHAGAAAREMLRAAAAQQWGVPLEECVAEAGRVTHEKSGRSGGYGDFALAAATVPVPDPPLRAARDFEVIGKSLGRLDAAMKVDGSAVF